MSVTDIMPAPDLKPLLPAMSKLERERAAFQRMLPELLRQYRNRYVAIHEEKVVGSGDELTTVALAAYERFGYQPIYVDLVTDASPPIVRVPHYRPIAPIASK
jgi:hypothetical protein